MEEIQTAYINQISGLSLPALLPQNEAANALAIYINELINTDFEKLVYILYRIDVSEKKLKEILEQKHENAGAMIADLIIERQLQKQKTRHNPDSYREGSNSINDEEKW